MAEINTCNDKNTGHLTVVNFSFVVCRMLDMKRNNFHTKSVFGIRSILLIANHENRNSNYPYFVDL